MLLRIIIIILICLNLTHAGSLASWSNGLVTGATESGGYFKSQTRGYYTLGSQTLKLNGQGTFSLGHVEVPRLTVGCGGIDANWGGFSFINDPKYLVEKLKAIGLSAAGYVFKQAITALCKDCAEAMDTLESFAQSINNFNLDTCTAGQRIASDSMAFFSNARQENMESGQSNNMIEENQKTETSTFNSYLQKTAYYLGGNNAQAETVVSEEIGYGSFLNKAIEKNDETDQYASDFLGKDGESGEGILTGVIRYLIGDVIVADSGVGAMPGAAGDKKSFSTHYIPPSEDIDKVIEAFVLGNKIAYKTVKYNDSTKKIILEKVKELDFNGGMVKIYETRLKSIIDKMKAFTPLDGGDKKFIEQQPIPIYRFLTTLALSDQSDLLNQTALHLAYMQTKIMLNHILWIGGVNLAAEIQRSSSKANKDAINNRKQILQDINKVKNRMAVVFESLFKNIERSDNYMETVRKLEQEIKAQGYGNLMSL